ncbi:kinase-like domain-containing protein [Favolaschia claudopus]|uniref:Kinase-like domain-containing protein n=1 Tax=Favolaschia claudopus TaxID=2862362 RepID=A0AAW0CNJ8_9AGAR
MPRYQRNECSSTDTEGKFCRHAPVLCLSPAQGARTLRVGRGAVLRWRGQKPRASVFRSIPSEGPSAQVPSLDEIPLADLEILKKIGSGGYKDVFLGTLHSEPVAIGQFRGAWGMQELKILAALDHPNIVAFFGLAFCEVSAVTFLILVIQDITNGVQYLHQRNPSVIHRDLKSSNVLLTQKRTIDSMATSLVGTVNWQAPELWGVPNPRYDVKVDVYSCAWCTGKAQWVLNVKTYPWAGMNEHYIYNEVGRRGKRPKTSNIAVRWPALVELLDRMWAQSPASRPTIGEASFTCSV